MANKRSGRKAMTTWGLSLSRFARAGRSCAFPLNWRKIMLAGLIPSEASGQVATAHEDGLARARLL